MPEDRDQLFEKVLARQLRAAAGDKAFACLDPETLAAYHERLLSPEEMVAAKDHLVGCSRCQKILAQLELTQDLVEGQDREVTPVVAFGTAAPEDSAPEMAAHSRSDSAKVPSTEAAKITQLPLRKIAVLRWAAPLGAIAAALLLWIGSSEFRAHKSPQGAATQISENRNERYLPAPAQPTVPQATLQDENRQAAPSVSSDEKEVFSRNYDSFSDSSKPAPQNAPPGKRSASGTRLDSLSKDDRGFGSGVGNRPVVKSKQAEQLPVAPSSHAADSAKPGEAAGGVLGGAMAKKSAAVAPATPDYEKETKSLPERDGLYSARERSAVAGQPGAAGTGRASKVLTPPSPPPPIPVRGPSQLRGTVTDPSGAVIARAEVALKSENGNTVAKTSTDNGGMYTFNDVVAGNYRLELQSPGFKTDTITGLNIVPGDNVRNASLEIGASTQTVEVAAQAIAVNREALETTESLPVNSLNYQALALLSSGFQSAASPDGKAIWRFGDQGRIIYSKNEGKDWTPQVSGVKAKLLAASAPGAKVCWIAGANGTLLRTSDGGKHWRRVAVPLTGDLGGVRATDTNHATIWDAPNQLRYETADGGLTWAPTTSR